MGSFESHANAQGVSANHICYQCAHISHLTFTNDVTLMLGASSQELNSESVEIRPFRDANGHTCEFYSAFGWCESGTLQMLLLMQQETTSV